MMDEPPDEAAPAAPAATRRGAALELAQQNLQSFSEVVELNRERVTAGDLSVRMGPVTTRDEIGEVATAIDAMLDRLEMERFCKVHGITDFIVEDTERPFLTRALRVPDRVTAHLLGDGSLGAIAGIRNARGNVFGLRAGLLLTFLMGLTFLATQVTEYARIGFAPYTDALKTPPAAVG